MKLDMGSPSMNVSTSTEGVTSPHKGLGATACRSRQMTVRWVSDGRQIRLWVVVEVGIKLVQIPGLPAIAKRFFF